jgi:hypothetical protein
MDNLQKIIVYIIILIIIVNVIPKNEHFSTQILDQLLNGSKFTDGNGNTITFINTSGSPSLQLVQANQTTPIILTYTPPSSTTAAPNTFYAQPPLKIAATVINNGDTINVNLADGQTILFTHIMQ